MVAQNVAASGRRDVSNNHSHKEKENVIRRNSLDRPGADVDRRDSELAA
jgi:hypothetical protein